MSGQTQVDSAPKTQGAATAVLVRPGNETGVYYILFSGLRVDTKWHHLKDHLKSKGGLEGIGNVEVFLASRTGWVEVYGPEAFGKVKAYLDKNSVINGMQAIVDFRNETEPTAVKGATALQPKTTLPATQYPAAFSSHIPPLDMSGSPYYMPQGAAASYTTPASINSAAASPYGILPTQGHDAYPGYESTNLEYYTAHPTRQHEYPSTRKTGVEGNELYTQSIAALSQGYASMSVQDAPRLTDANFKLSVKRRADGEITEDMVVEFLRNMAPITRAKDAIKSIHIHKGRGYPPGPKTRALVIFSSAEVCTLARNILFDKEFNGIRLVQSASDDAVTAPAQRGQSNARFAPATSTWKEHTWNPMNPNAAQGGWSSVPSGGGPNSTDFGPGLASSSSSGGQIKSKPPPGGRRRKQSSAKVTDSQRETGETSAEKEKKPLVVNGPLHSHYGEGTSATKGKKPLVVDGTVDSYHKHKDGEAMSAGKGKKPLVVNGTTASHHKEKQDGKKRHK